MTFALKHLLWLLLVIPPLLAVFLWWAGRKRQALMSRFIQARLLPGLTLGISPTRQKVRALCVVSAVIFILVALARPQWGYHYEEVSQRGLDIVVAIDTSKSMLAEDIAPNRLQRAKLASLDLMQQAKSDRLGLIAFAGGAFLQCPMTIDDSAFRQSVEALDVNIIPQGGTALAEAINKALSAFKEQENYKVLVLFTDGEDNDEGAVTAAQAAAKEGLRIYTVGIGTAEGELLRLSDNKGRTDYVRDGQGNVVKSRLNEGMLQEIARATEGGFYLPLRGANTIDVLYEELNKLPKSQSSERLVRQYHEQFHWPLALGIVLLLVEMLLPERVGKRVSTPKGQRRVMAASAAAMFVLVFCPETIPASQSSALRDYNAGQYDQALQEYHRLLERRTNDMRLRFNTGAAAYRNEKYDEAVRQFGRATTAEDLNVQQQAYYNLGNTLYRIGEGVSEREKKIENWEGALKQYDGAIKLNTNDADAKFNYEFVKRKLDELKKEEEQQKQQDQKQDEQKNDGEGEDKQNSKSDQDQQQQNQDSKDKNQQQQSEDQQQEKEQQNQDKSEQEKEQQQKEQQQKPQDQQQKENKPDEQSGQEEPQTAGPRPMTPQEAQQLLDAQQGGEQILIFKPAEPERRPAGSFKDW